jgi:hypothetical protein
LIAPLPSLITIKDGATVLGTTVASGAGAWIFTNGVLGQGPHSFTATATDAAGNTGAASTALGVTLDARLVFDLTILGPNFGFIIQGDAAGEADGQP